MEKLLIVDDSSQIRKQLKWGLSKDYHILLAESVDDALKQFDKSAPAVVTLDLGLPPDIDGASEGLRCLELMLSKRPETKIIVLSGNEDHGNALAAVDLGAYDFYHKPIDLAELKIILARAFHVTALEKENRQLKTESSRDNKGFSGIFGQCPQMQKVFDTIKKVTSVNVPVLILGESGTGKEVVAQAIHRQGLRRDHNFIAINCGAIPETLLESELFGHEKGAFTGAQSRVQGKVEYADGGTLFLDEIGEMPGLLQVKLLRFLQEKVMQRVGGREDIAVDTRIIAATNIDIEQSIKQGTFREDLYYRIGVITIELPPLRERGDDIELLANVFMQRFSHEFGKKVRGFSLESIDYMKKYEWPGNVRELENKVKRAIVMAETPIIEAWDLGFAERAEGGAARGGQQHDAAGLLNVDAVLDDSMTLKEARYQVEHRLLQATLEKTQGNVQKAAELLAVSRPTMYDLMKKHGLQMSE